MARSGLNTRMVLIAERLISPLCIPYSAALQSIKTVWNEHQNSIALRKFLNMLAAVSREASLLL